MGDFFDSLSKSLATLNVTIAGLKKIPVNASIAAGIIAVFVLVATWEMVFSTNTQGSVVLRNLSSNKIARKLGIKKNWHTLLLMKIFIVASCLCYYKAMVFCGTNNPISLGELAVTLVLMFIFFLLRENSSGRTVVGTALVAYGVFIMVI